ncbi:MAG: hypothetical protein GX540_08145 [Clostridiales bacterium]|nr:hypothetical protein [Clostridiales bacterium]
MRKFPFSVLAIVLALLMVAAALFIGAVKGSRVEKAQVESALGSLGTVFTTRVETGNNLLTVARRHLPQGDERMAAVARDVQALSSQASLAARTRANTSLEENARALLAILKDSESVQADSRDMAYVTGLLPQALDQSAQWTDVGSYNEAAGAYNDRLNNTFSGLLARLLGQTEAELFTP